MVFFLCLASLTTIEQKFITQTKDKLIKDKFNFPMLDYSNVSFLFWFYFGAFLIVGGFLIWVFLVFQNGGILDTAKPTEEIMRVSFFGRSCVFVARHGANNSNT